jgi:Pentapeptide repeats (8 copies)
LRIDNIENYLRIVDTTKDIDTTKNRKIKSYECLDELKNGVERFNEYVQGSVIHLPYLVLNEIQDELKLNLSGANLSGANLVRAELLRAILLYANLSGADLFGANLFFAELSGADLFGADLSGANLVRANLTRANLSDAIISNSIFIGLRDYESLKLNKKTLFKNVISDNIEFIYYTSKFTENIPNFANNKKELKTILKRCQ